MILNYQNAKQKLLTDLDNECQQFFVKNGCGIEYGYSMLLSDDLISAKRTFDFYKDSDIRAKWALFMISLIEESPVGYPTYLELRDFLEIDLNILIHYCKGNYVESILKYSDFLFGINPEIYKFIGRVLYNNDMPEQAMFFLSRAKNYFYNDPELHYLLAYIHYNNKNYDKAKQSVDNCLRILPEYFPAVNMKEILISVE